MKSLILQPSDELVRLKKLFDVFIQFLIVISLLTFSLETIPENSDQTRFYLSRIEVFIISVFTVEYVFRIFLAKDKLKYLFSFWGIIDLLSILPFYISLGLNLSSIRVFRLLRLIRIFKLARYSGAICRYHRAFVIAKEELILFISVALIILYLASVGIYYFENPVQPDSFSSIFHSLWWAVATLTTVGYGDVYPITVGGKVFTFFVLVVGLGIVSIPAGLIASALSKAREMDI
jgi:voltage-gated potassium channel